MEPPEAKIDKVDNVTQQSRAGEISIWQWTDVLKSAWKVTQTARQIETYFET